VTARPLRVLWLTKGLGPGGAERLLVTHAAASDRTQIDFEAAYLLSHKTHLVDELEALGVPTHDLRGNHAADPRWTARLRSLLDTGDFDILHAHSPLPAAQARPVVHALPRVRRPAFVYTEHNRWPSHSRGTRLANRATFGANDAVIAVSNEVRDSLAPRWRGGTHVVVHGIDVEAVARLRADRDEVRAELRVAPDEIMVVTVANFRASKGHRDLFAAAKLVAEAGAPVRFVVVGQGPLAAELEVERRRLALGDGLTIVGYRADAARITAAADLFVLASHHEGLPVAVMEALAAGVPVVATDVGGLPEAITEGVSGRLVPVADPGRLAQAVVELADDPQQRRRLAEGAGAAADRFSAARSEAEIEAIYRTALARAALRSTSRARRWR
jgi:glycosyltransferase involved in cell wall biosynthesis